MNSFLDIPNIESRCSGRMGHKIIWNFTSSSTNDDIKSLFDSDEKEGVVCLAEHQTAGRGRTGPWSDEAGTMLLMSVLLRPQCDLKRSSEYVLAAAKAVADALSYLIDDDSIDVSVKYPNDVLINGKKVCGILQESHSKGDVLLDMALGIGVNVNTSAAFFEEQGLPEATSLFLATARTFSREDVVVGILSSLKGSGL